MKDFKQEVKQIMQSIALTFMRWSAIKLWTVTEIERLGFRVITNSKEWYHFRGHGFDVHINLKNRNNVFTFHSYKANFKGNFKIEIFNPIQFRLLLDSIK